MVAGATLDGSSMSVRSARFSFSVEVSSHARHNSTRRRDRASSCLLRSLGKALASALRPSISLRGYKSSGRARRDIVWRRPCETDATRPVVTFDRSSN